MKCKKVKDIIITDYIDGELNAGFTHEIEEHIGKCDSCRIFLNELRDKVSKPVKMSGEMSPPGEIWEKIKGNIEKEKIIGSLPSRGFRLRDIIIMPRPVALAAAIIAVVAVTVTIPRIFREERAVIGEYFMDNMEFLYYMETEEFEKGESDQDMDVNYFM